MLEEYFKPFRENIIGYDLKTADQKLNIIYSDWTASGRLYAPIEEYLSKDLGRFVANPHTENNEMGRKINSAYHNAKTIIKRHVNANDNDALICTGAGATSAIIKLQRIMGLTKAHSQPQNLMQQFTGALFSRLAKLNIKTSYTSRPVVFVTHMEHHSNHTSWNECNVDVVVLDRAPDGQPCIKHLEHQLQNYKNRKVKIGAFTACSNVTGIQTNIHQLAKTMHLNDGVCFADYACSAPYVDIDMHPNAPLERLDAIYFSPHKFLGGPGTSGVLIFNKALYARTHCAPDRPGGGTVLWTNPWGQQAYFSDIEKREDGGTPPFLQTIKTAAAIELKESMTVAKIAEREDHLRRILMSGLAELPSVRILEPHIKQRLCIVSFYMENIHFNLIVRLLSDRFGIQARGGCSCAGTYGHVLLDVDQKQSAEIVAKLNAGDLSSKPGWVRISLHPTNTDEEAFYILDAIAEIEKNIHDWQHDYEFLPQLGDFRLKQHHQSEAELKHLLWAS
jgi:selenocysteine lyase/cysteine desulfurase